MKKISLFTLILLTHTLMAQKVNNKAYDLMLSTMLSHSVDEINVDEASNKDNALFIDAREKKEYDVSRIKNSIWVGYDQYDLSPLKEVSKEQEIIVYCSVGYRSEKIAEKLAAEGFTNVKNLYGGIFEWVNQDQEVVSSAGEPTDSVHAYSKMWGVWLSKGEKVYK